MLILFSIILGISQVISTTFTPFIQTTGDPVTTDPLVVEFFRHRGSNGFFSADQESGSTVDVWYTETEGGQYSGETGLLLPSSGTAPLTTLQEPNEDVMGRDIAYVTDKVIDNVLWVSASNTQFGGNVYSYTGSFASWTIAQVLSPPPEYNEYSYYGWAMDIDPHTRHKAVVGCMNCNGTGSGSGTLYLYEATKPDAKKWTQTSALTTTTDLYRVGGSEVEIYDKLLVADYETPEAGTGITKNAVIFFEKPDGKWTQQQTLSNSFNISDLDLYDETIVIGYEDATAKFTSDEVGAVHVFYPNTKRFGKPKPPPVQWSLQQVLYAPAQTVDDGFGSVVSLDGNRMVVGNGIGGTQESYVFERTSLSGKWSLQQIITRPVVDTFDIDLHDDTIFMGGTSALTIYTQSNTWDCLIISVEDHFGDGWDTAQLVVETPTGEKDFFYQRCDTGNPHQFRYCPANEGDSGLYKFSIPDGKKAKFFWEIIWRVFDEGSGVWYTGNWDTTMDFHWDSEVTHFIPRRIAHTLPNNITCKVCPERPVATSSIRSLKGKDSTVAPTISPAPTIEVDDDLSAPWQWMSLTSAAGLEWFEEQHKGTSYYISDSKAHRLLAVGTMCPNEATTKQCWEDLPDGDYIVRVGGGLDVNVATNTFRYCRAANEISAQTQLNIRIAEGDCVIMSDITQDFYCKNEVDIVELAQFDIWLVGVADTSLGKTEHEMLSNAFASSFKGVDSDHVKLLWTSHGAGQIYMKVEVGFSANALHHIDFGDNDVLVNLQNNILQNTDSYGKKLFQGLVSEEVLSAFHGIQSVRIADVKFVGSKQELLAHYPTPLKVTDFADERSSSFSANDASAEAIQETFTVLSVTGFVVLAAVCTIVIFMAYKKASGSELQMDKLKQQFTKWLPEKSYEKVSKESRRKLPKYSSQKDNTDAVPENAVVNSPVKTSCNSSDVEAAVYSSSSSDDSSSGDSECGSFSANLKSRELSASKVYTNVRSMMQDDM